MMACQGDDVVVPEDHSGIENLSAEACDRLLESALGRSELPTGVDNDPGKRRPGAKDPVRSRPAPSSTDSSSRKKDT